MPEVLRAHQHTPCGAGPAGAALVESRVRPQLKWPKLKLTRWSTAPTVQVAKQARRLLHELVAAAGYERAV